MLKFRHFFKRLVQLSFLLAALMALAIYFELLTQFYITVWVSLAFYFCFTLISGYYITRSIGKPVFMSVFLGFLVSKLILSSLFVFGYIKLLPAKTQPTIIIFITMYLIFKVFETLITVKYIKEIDSK